MHITWLHLAILILAAFRLTHLVVFDTITWFIRKHFHSITTAIDSNGRTVQQISIKGTGWRYWVGALLTCHWCVGIWSALLLTALYYWVPILFPLTVLLAIAGAAAVLEQHASGRR